MDTFILLVGPVSSCSSFLSHFGGSEVPTSARASWRQALFAHGQCCSCRKKIYDEFFRPVSGILEDESEGEKLIAETWKEMQEYARGFVCLSILPTRSMSVRSSYIAVARVP